MTPEHRETVIRSIILAMYDDHVKYPQLHLPKMQENRLQELMALTKPDKPTVISIIAKVREWLCHHDSCNAHAVIKRERRRNKNVGARPLWPNDEHCDCGLRQILAGLE